MTHGYFGPINVSSSLTLTNPLQFKGAIQVLTDFPVLTDVETGWFYRVTTLAAAITSITRSGSTATVTTTAAHTFGDGIKVIISGADQSEYNGEFTITLVDSTHFTYTVSGTPATPATGTITSTTKNVVDDDATKTNTGQTFSVGDEIAWNGTNWTELGSTDLWIDNTVDIYTATNTRGMKAAYSKVADTNQSNYLQMYWNENDTSDRNLAFKVNSGNRTIDLSENFTVGDGYDVTITSQDAASSITLDNATLEIENANATQRAMKIIHGTDADASITIEGTSSVINQDLTSDSTPTFASLNLSAANNQIVLQSGGVKGTITATPTTSAKVWTLQDVTGTIYQTGGDDVALADGGTNASLTASKGGIVYSTDTALAILSATATANQIMLSGSNDAPSWSTATYPATTTANQILYSNATNTITGLTTANSSLLVTNGSGVPSLSTTVPNGVTATTQSPSDNSTKLATTAYVDAAVATVDTWDEVIHNGESTTIADTENLSVTINQNDTTNNPAALVITNTGSGNDITLPNSSYIENGVAYFTSKVILPSSGALYYGRVCQKSDKLTGFSDFANPIAKCEGLTSQYSGELFEIIVSDRGNTYSKTSFKFYANTSLQKIDEQYNNTNYRVSAKRDSTGNIVEFYLPAVPTNPGDTVVYLKWINVNDSGLDPDTNLITINPGATALTAPSNSTDSTDTKNFFPGDIRLVDDNEIHWSDASVKIVGNSTAETLNFQVNSANKLELSNDRATVVTNGDTDSFQIRRDSVSDDDPAILGFRVSTSSGTSNMAEIQAVRTNSPSTSDTEIYIKNNKSGSLSTSIYIDTAGQVAIGEVTTANSKFHVYKNTDCGLLIESDNSNDASLLLMESSGTGSDSVFGTTGNGIRIRHDGSENIIIFETSSSANVYTNFTFDRSNNSAFKYYGYITAATSIKYVQFQINDTDDKFHISEEDAYILGMAIDMPLDTENILINGAQKAKRTASATDYNPSALTTDYIIAITNTDADRAVTISTEDEDSGTTSNPRIFVIKDESGGAESHNITISLESGGNIDGAANVAIGTDYGSVTLYTDGTNAWTI